MPASSTMTTLPRMSSPMRLSCKRRSIVMASAKPTFCSSSTALIVGATASTLRPASFNPRSSSRSVAVLPVPAAPLMLTARSRDRSTNSTACLLLRAQTIRGDERNVQHRAARISPTPRLMAAIMLRSRSRLVSVATSRPDRNILPADSCTPSSPFRWLSRIRPRPCRRASVSSVWSRATDTRSKM